MHQPEHLPWPGFFHKMAVCNFYVYLDDVQFKKNNFQNRNKIKGALENPIWVTVPVKSGRLAEKINEKKIVETEWKAKYLEVIRRAYYRSKFYEEYYPALEEIIIKSDASLAKLNLSLIEWFRKCLNIKTPFCFSSELAHEGNKSDLILEICSLLSAGKYLSGPSGIEYLDINSFSRKGIEVMFHNFRPPEYESNGSMIAGLSTLDLLMFYGQDSMEIINNAQKIKD